MDVKEANSGRIGSLGKQKIDSVVEIVIAKVWRKKNISWWVKKKGAQDLVSSKAREGEERYSAGDITSENIAQSCVLADQNPLIICLRMNFTLLPDMGMNTLIFYPLPSGKTSVHFLQGNNSHLLVIPVRPSSLLSEAISQNLINILFLNLVSFLWLMPLAFSLN